MTRAGSSLARTQFSIGRPRTFSITKAPVFWINDPSRTDQMIYPPGYPLWVASIYAATGDRSPVAVQRVQLLLDSLAVLLLVGIGATAFRWSVGIAAGVLGALSPLLALAGATPNADAPTSWIVLGGVWLLLLAAKRQTIKHAIAAGVLLGLACWLRVNPLLMFVPWAVALLLFVKASWRRKLALSAAVSFSTLLVISPVVIRNVVVFYPEIAPTGLSVGLNLWEGIGETDRGAEFGAPSSDAEVEAQDRKEMGLPPDAPLRVNYPDGIRRDHERGRKALAVIKAHPVWYTGTMARRVWGHLKFAGAPAPHVGSVGFNVTSRKCLPTRSSGRRAGAERECAGHDPERLALPRVAADALRSRFVFSKGLAHDRSLAGDRALLPGDSGGRSFRDSLRIADAGAADHLCGGRGVLAGYVCGAPSFPETQRSCLRLIWTTATISAEVFRCARNDT